MIDHYGWSPALQHDFRPFVARGLQPARVTVQQRGAYRLVTPLGEMTGALSGRFAHEALEGDYPVAGDWVAAALRPEEGSATIQALLPRRSAFTRKAAGPGRPTGQVVAANADVAFLVTSLNADLNARRIERYLATAWESGAAPVVVLTKADLCPDRDGALAEIEAVALGVPVHVVSAVTGEGIDGLRDGFAPGRTAVLLGSSGVGKSSLVNALAGTALMATGAIREDDARGRHTTTHRELVLLPDGRLVLDTPGMRELGLWDAGDGVTATFADIEALAAECRFADCRHETEPGCAVRAALEDGRLDPERWRAWGKLQRELAHLERKEDPLARERARKVWIQRHKQYRAGKKRGDWG
ncbi:ribosome small subunit-dependent GTPase A [Inquilinus limosus]|uniref:ribosome small subunit-dependent GTPase A n=1 Tax=Inquilinus limosus TaxID=171674 RepID=UPI0003F537DB|nr:ribosome small subunit-dependent GTPase A [Inquilinus limosus]